MAVQAGDAGSIFVKLGLNMSQFEKGITSAKNKMRSMERSMENAGQKMTAALTVPILAGAAASVKAFTTLEDALIELEKVSDKQTVDALREPLIEMSEEVPIAAEKLIGLAADAARFGVTGPENILRFTEAVSKMATATDLNATQAGEAFAKLTTLTGTPIEQIENLGSSINALGNTMATSESEIVQAALRSAAGLSQMGLSATEIIALNASLNEVSESSERAGTRLRGLSAEMTDPGRVQDLATALGMTTDEFVRMRDNDPAAVIFQMIQAFEEGGEAADQLSTSLNREAIQALKGLAQNAESTEAAFDRAAQGFEENTSLQREFAAAIDSTSADLKTFWNTMNNAAATIGEAFGPLIAKLTTRLKRVLQQIKGASAESRAWWLAMLALTAAAGPLTLALSKFVGVLWRTVAALTALNAPMVALGAIALSFAAVAATVVARWEEFRTFFGNMLEGIMGVFSNSTKFMLAAWEEMVGKQQLAFVALANKVIGLFSTVAKFAAAVGVDVAKPWVAAFNAMEEESEKWGVAIAKNVKDAKERQKEAAAEFKDSFIQAMTRIVTAQDFAAGQMQDVWFSVIESITEKWESFQDLFMPSGRDSGGDEEESPGPSQPLGMDALGMMESLKLIQKPLQDLINKLNAAQKEQDETETGWSQMSRIGQISVMTLQQSFGALFEAFTTFGDEIISVKERFKDFGRAMLRILSRVISRLAAAVATAAALKLIMTAFGIGSIGGLSSFGDILGSIVGLQSGGIIKNGPLPAILHGDEAVVPLDRMNEIGGLPENLNLTASIDLDRLIFRLEQRMSHNSA